MDARRAKANAEAERLASVTVDEVINELLDMAAKQKPAPDEDLLLTATLTLNAQADDQLETMQHGEYA